MSRSRAYWAGVPLILIGIIFLLRNYAGLELSNWWALLMFIPAFYMLWRAYTIYQSKGASTKPAWSSLLAGLMIIGAALVFLLGLNWTMVWPVFAIVIGIMFLVSPRFA